MRRGAPGAVAWLARFDRLGTSIAAQYALKAHEIATLVRHLFGQDAPRPLLEVFPVAVFREIEVTDDRHVLVGDELLPVRQRHAYLQCALERQAHAGRRDELRFANLALAVFDQQETAVLVNELILAKRLERRAAGGGRQQKEN